MDNFDNNQIASRPAPPVDAGATLTHTPGTRVQISSPERNIENFVNGFIIGPINDFTGFEIPGISLQRTGTPWIDVAYEQLGTSEYGVVANPRILEYHSSTSLSSKLAASDETAWCSSFACWTFDQVGIANPGSAWAPDWAAYGTVLDQPVAGAIILVNTMPGNNLDYDHIGFVQSVNKNNTVNILGGNQSDKVSVYQLSTDKIKLILRPVGFTPPKN